jgi:hypothetical protein
MAKLNFGLGQARILCRTPTNERLDLIAEGLPIILESARGFWTASEQLADKPREADVLEGFTEEEAAKILYPHRSCSLSVKDSLPKIR